MARQIEMITGHDTNTVHFSGLLKTDRKYRVAFESIKSLLEKHHVHYELLKDTKDIWCRDYMPIQIEEDKFVQFRYEPTYLKGARKLQSDPKLVLSSNSLNAEFSSINLDGGNVVNWTEKVILTDRIFTENPRLNSVKLRSELERIFKSEVLIIPNLEEDLTGHADGHLRFIDSNTILVNTLKQESPKWRKGFMKMIDESGLKYVEMPWYEQYDRLFKYSAIGCYVNYLEIGNLILFPVFEVAGNKDEEALGVIRSVFPERIIEPININEIANHGGLLNCCTWTIKN